MPACAAILQQAALTWRCRTDKNRALLRQAVSFARVGTAVRSTRREIALRGLIFSAVLRDIPSLDEGSSDAAFDTETYRL
jgi:hypothetical protein